VNRNSDVLNRFAPVALEYFATFRCDEKTNAKINALSKIKRARDIFRREETTLFTRTRMIITDINIDCVRIYHSFISIEIILVIESTT